MILLNFGHPLPPAHLARIKELTGQQPEVVVVPTEFDHKRPFAEQVRELVDGIGLTAEEWQTTPLLINPPTLHIIAMTSLAELHGRMGYFPAVLRLRPIPDTIPSRFEVAEIINLQSVRDEARRQR